MYVSIIYVITIVQIRSVSPELDKQLTSFE